MPTESAEPREASKDPKAIVVGKEEMRFLDAKEFLSLSKKYIKDNKVSEAILDMCIVLAKEGEPASDLCELIEEGYILEDITLIYRKGWTKDEIKLKGEGWIREQIVSDDGTIIGHKMVVPYVEEYCEVIFAEKSNPNDTVDAIISVDGECLVMQRGKKVIIPKRFLLAADHGTHDVFRQMPDEERKVLFKVQTFPYTTIREGLTYKDYTTMRAKHKKVSQKT